MNILELLEYEEGFRKEAYYCSEGYPTIGIGLKIGPKGAPLSNYIFTMSLDVAYVDLGERVTIIGGQLASNQNTLMAFMKCNSARRDILKSMAYQLGFGGVCKFKKMLKAMEAEDWNEAAKQALDSRWAKQTPKRANRHADVIRMGTYKGVY